MTLPTEPIGSIPRPPALIQAMRERETGTIPAATLDALYDAAIIDTLRHFEETGSPVITDGEQRKYHNFFTYGVTGLPNLCADGFQIPFLAGQIRTLPRLAGGPFRYKMYGDEFLDFARRHTTAPLKQAIIAPSALSLLYPAEEVTGYPRDHFIDDLLREHETELRRCLSKGAHSVQIDFTEGRLSIKVDPTGHLLNSFIDLNNIALDKLTEAEIKRVGVHTCPGGDCDSTHSADVDYAELLPSLFELRVTNFFVQLASEPDRPRVLQLIQHYLKPKQRVFVGVIDPINPRIETPQDVCDRVLEAARYIPLDQLGTTDDCGFSPFSDDVSTSRATAFAKIRARVEGTAMAAKILGL